MNTCHCKDESVPVNSNDVPWARQSLRLRRFVALFIETFLPSAYHCQHFLSRQVYFSNCMVFGVTYIDKVLVFSEYMTQAERVVELYLVV